MMAGLAFAGIVGTGTAVAQAPDPRNTTHIIDFPDCCPRPAWWDEVEGAVPIQSMEQFMAVWQNQALNDRQKAKALFQAIEDFARRDDDITAAAVNYYYWVDRDYPHIRRLYEFGVGYYLEYDRPLDNYGGKVGDMSAGMVNNLAKFYLRDGEPARAVPWLRYIIENREAEVNEHILEVTAAQLGNALNRLGRGPEAIEVLLAARRKYDGDWEKRLDDELATVRAKMGLSYYLYDTRLSLSALGVALVLALGATILWRRRRGRA